MLFRGNSETTSKGGWWRTVQEHEREEERERLDGVGLLLAL